MVGESTSSPDFFHTSIEQFSSQDDIFSILDTLDGVSDEFKALIPLDETRCCLNELVSQKSTSSADLEAFSPRTKRQKVKEGCENSDGCMKLNHVTVERNRRKQMNEHLTVLRSLMPCFYVKRVNIKFNLFYSIYN